jgi:monoamine oxidase
MEATQEKVIRILKDEPQFDRQRHGSLWDRGSADSYYGRMPEPHWYPEGTYNGEKITDLTVKEIMEYYAGYEDNEKFGDKKDWG